MKKQWWKVGMAIVALMGALALTGCAEKNPASSGTDGSADAVAEEGATPAPGETGFTEIPIGDPQDVEGLTVAAVYFRAAAMEPVAGPGPEESDIHLEADIAAAEGNKTGFGIGEFVPYLSIDYVLTKKDTGETIEGSMMPMNASDGAHYGNNVKMLGAGNYELTMRITSPEKQGYVLHTDSETGVEGRFWKKPIELKWDFAFVPAAL
jgi:uncharacterized protein involved in high-affinity Fe2+ transport